MTKPKRPPGRRNFPECPQCPYLHQSLVSVCADCASEQLASITDPCPICSQQLQGTQCRNALCTGRAGDIHIESITAITLYKEPLKEVMERYKYHNKYGWAVIFARLLVGYLSADRRFERIGLVMGNPSNPGRGHIRAVMGHARKYPTPHGPLPIDPTDDPAVDKTIGTGKSAGHNLPGKQSAAERHAQALTCRHPERIRNKTILVYDDICTTGLQLNAVAGRLRRWGAAAVHGVVLARQPWS